MLTAALDLISAVQLLSPGPEGQAPRVLLQCHWSGDLCGNLTGSKERLGTPSSCKAEGQISEQRYVHLPNHSGVFNRTYIWVQTWSRSQFLVWFCTEKWFFWLKLCLTSGGSTRCWNPISLFLLFVGLCFPLFLHLAGMQVKPQFCSRRKENRWWIYALFIVNVVFFKHFLAWLAPQLRSSECSSWASARAVLLLLQGCFCFVTSLLASSYPNWTKRPENCFI